MKKMAVSNMVVIRALVFSPALVFAQGNAQKGKELFTQNCASCHGATGKGDGAAAVALNPKPRNLSDKAYMGKLKDQQLIDIIKKGGAASGKSPLMPPFGGVLSDADVRNVVAFIRQLSK